MNEPLILGLCGPAGVGKDLVADWLCERKFVKIAFADPMKRFAKDAFGLEWQQLWGPSQERNRKFKINSDWWFNAIANFNKAASEIAQFLLQEGNRVQGCLSLYQWLTDLRVKYPEEISARIILQSLGTEWGRNTDELMWATYGNTCAHNLFDYQHQMEYTQSGGLKFKPSFAKLKYGEIEGIVIPDHRFLNEIEETQKQGGKVIRIRRPVYEAEIANTVIGIAGHVSEAEQREIPDSAFDYILNFEEGIEKVYLLLNETFLPWLTSLQVPHS